MRIVLPLALLVAGAATLQASILQTISLDLSDLHPNSTLSGTFTLSDSPAIGDTAPVHLTFTDPLYYSPTSLDATISILGGTPSGFAVDFSPLSFTNLSGTTTPINTRDVSLMRFAFAMCPSFPCTATGGFEDRSPAVFRADYKITPAGVPEPAYGLLLPALVGAIIFRRRILGS